MDMENNVWLEANMWCSHWVCCECGEKIKCCVSEKKYLNRNLKNKKICKKCSLIKQKGEGNPFHNKTHNQNSKEKISKTKKGVKTSNHMSNQKYRNLFSILAKERWSNGTMEKVREKLSTLMKARITNGEIKGYNRSKAEDEIIEYLTSLGLETIPNFIISGKIFDIYIPKFNLLLEYNGDYWHCNPSKYSFDYLNKKKNKTAEEIWEYDKDKLYLAKNSGYICEVIWETDYKKDKTIIKTLIQKYEKQ